MRAILDLVPIASSGPVAWSQCQALYWSSVPTAMGAFMNKGLSMKTGRTHVHKYRDTLMRLIEDGKVDPTVIITHRTADLGDGPDLYKTFRAKEDGCVKVVMLPHGRSAATTKGPRTRVTQSFDAAKVEWNRQRRVRLHANRTQIGAAYQSPNRTVTAKTAIAAATVRESTARIAAT